MSHHYKTIYEIEKPFGHFVKPGQRDYWTLGPGSDEIRWEKPDDDPLGPYGHIGTIAIDGHDRAWQYDGHLWRSGLTSRHYGDFATLVAYEGVKRIFTKEEF